MKLLQVAIALDQLLNTLFGGYADETLSSRAYRMRRDGKPWPERVINGLFFWQEDHCYEAYMSEVKRRQYPPEFRFVK